jgi:Methane oxygenase PmoA
MALRITILILLAAQVAIAQDTSSPGSFSVEQTDDRLAVKLNGNDLGSFVFRDAEIRRPYFCNLHSSTGIKLTRNHPPIEGQDQVDHATMHPGVWLAFGDINGFDFWRNKANIQHIDFAEKPIVSRDQVKWATSSLLMDPSDKAIGNISMRFRIDSVPSGVLLVWQTTFSPIQQTLIFGDQEEMGLGIRVATNLTEKNGGKIESSEHRTWAKNTWGQAANWCDYSKEIDARKVGITVMSSPTNFRSPWWHNRDYGLMVANCFGRSAMKQGEPSQIHVKTGETLSLEFAVLLHDLKDYDPAKAYEIYSRP